MAWYDLFSNFYDQSLESLYAEGRQAAAAALRLAPGLTVLDCPCGTGQSFDGLAPPLLPGGLLVGVDVSAGMLRRGRARAEARHFSHVQLVELSVLELTSAQLPVPLFDRVQVFLGLSAFPDWRAAFARLWSVLKPGGRMVVVDVFSAKLSLQGRLVNLIARADIRRPTWEPLQEVAGDFTRTELTYRKQHGGQLFLATGVKPAGAAVSAG